MSFHSMNHLHTITGADIIATARQTRQSWVTSAVNGCRLIQIEGGAGLDPVLMQVEPVNNRCATLRPDESSAFMNIKTHILIHRDSSWNPYPIVSQCRSCTWSWRRSSHNRWSSSIGSCLVLHLKRSTGMLTPRYPAACKIMATPNTHG